MLPLTIRVSRAGGRHGSPRLRGGTGVGVLAINPGSTGDTFVLTRQAGGGRGKCEP
jgi:hypothetical protein